MELNNSTKKRMQSFEKKEYLSKWKEDIKKGGTIFDKCVIIASWIASLKLDKLLTNHNQKLTTMGIGYCCTI